MCNKVFVLLTGFGSGSWWLVSTGHHQVRDATDAALRQDPQQASIHLVLLAMCTPQHNGHYTTDTDCLSIALLLLCSPPQEQPSVLVGWMVTMMLIVRLSATFDLAKPKESLALPTPCNHRHMPWKTT